MAPVLLCALDLTEDAVEIGRYAHELAQGLGWAMRGVHVCDLPLTPHPGTVTDALSAASKRFEQILERATGAPDAAAQVRTGPTHHEILAAADEHDAELIVLSTRARGAIRRAVLGSTAESVLKASARPVLALPSGAPWRLPSRVVVAYDLVDRAALELAARLGPLDPQVTVLHAVSPDSTKGADDFAARLDADIRSVFGPRASKVSTHVVAAPALPAIQGFARESEADLLMTGRSRRSVIARSFFGTTSVQLIREARAPVLMVPEAVA